MASNTIDQVAQNGLGKKPVKAMATKFLENFTISMFKKHRKICRHGLVRLNVTPTFKKSFRDLWATLYIYSKQHLRNY
jgi:hypothetical protein